MGAPGPEGSSGADGLPGPRGRPGFKGEAVRNSTGIFLDHFKDSYLSVIQFYRE